MLERLIKAPGLFPERREVVDEEEVYRGSSADTSRLHTSQPFMFLFENEEVTLCTRIETR